MKRKASFTLGEYLFLCFAMFAVGAYIGAAFTWAVLK